jgi:isocitrate lyase
MISVQEIRQEIAEFNQRIAEPGQNFPNQAWAGFHVRNLKIGRNVSGNYITTSGIMADLSDMQRKDWTF